MQKSPHFTVYNRLKNIEWLKIVLEGLPSNSAECGYSKVIDGIPPVGMRTMVEIAHSKITTKYWWCI
jgi:hypothetical protein